MNNELPASSEIELEDHIGLRELTDEEWQSQFERDERSLDERKERAKEDIKAAVFGKLDYGNVSGEELVSPSTYSAEQIKCMSVEELQSALLSIQEIYWNTRVKLSQYRRYVPSEIVRRDPMSGLRVIAAARSGLTDGEIADELGEKVRYVQDVRLDVARQSKNAVIGLKRPRGRPRKQKKTP